MSKGSSARPTDKSKFDKNWDRIFGKPKDKKESKGSKEAK
jgi:hypothetical protein